MTTAIIKSDSQIKSDVLNELKWDSRIDETEIGVQVRDGIVTLDLGVDLLEALEDRGLVLSDGTYTTGCGRREGMGACHGSPQRTFNRARLAVAHSAQTIHRRVVTVTSCQRCAARCPFTSAGSSKIAP